MYLFDRKWRQGVQGEELGNQPVAKRYVRDQNKKGIKCGIAERFRLMGKTKNYKQIFLSSCKIIYNLNIIFVGDIRKVFPAFLRSALIIA